MEAARTADEMLEPDLAFQGSIAQATKNHLLTYMGNMPSLALRESIRIAHTHPEAKQVSLPRHKAILTALLNRDALAARQAMMLLQLDSAKDDLEVVFTRSKEQQAET